MMARDRPPASTRRAPRFATRFGIALLGGALLGWLGFATGIPVWILPSAAVKG